MFEILGSTMAQARIDEYQRAAEAVTRGRHMVGARRRERVVRRRSDRSVRLRRREA